MPWWRAWPGCSCCMALKTAPGPMKTEFGCCPATRSGVAFWIVMARCWPPAGSPTTSTSSRGRWVRPSGRPCEIAWRRWLGCLRPSWRRSAAAAPMRRGFASRWLAASSRSRCCASGSRPPGSRAPRWMWTSCAAIPTAGWQLTCSVTPAGSRKRNTPSSSPRATGSRIGWAAVGSRSSLKGTCAASGAASRWR